MSESPGPQECIHVLGARLHNLRDVDVSIPRNRLVALTGVSGSGKSSLAFGTIHGEAQRRYFDSVAPFARRLIHTALDPQVRDVTGLPPAVALEQRRAGGSGRSTVGTVTTTGNTLRMLFSRCGDYPADVAPMDSDHFSPNTAVGACPVCSGLGVVHEPTESSMVPDPGLSIAEGAVAAWPGAWQGKNYRDIVATLGHDVDVPWRALPQASRDWILHTEEEPVVTVVPEREAGRIQRPYQGRFASARRYLMRTLSETRSATQRARALRYVVSSPCRTCGGRRLRPEALRVTCQGLAVDEASRLPVADLLPVLTGRLAVLDAEHPRSRSGEGSGKGAGQEPSARAEAERLLLQDLTGRLQVLVDLGIGHLDLARPSTSVSAGELQRLRVATAVRSGLFGVVYVLDEPSAGLHPRDTEALLRALRGLVDAGNSVLVVEHDMAVVTACDWVVDVGPGAGSQGGRVLWSGPLDGFQDVPGSVTARYLHDPVHATEIRPAEPSAGAPAGVTAYVAPRPRRGELRVTGIERHTLHDVAVTLPLGVLTVVTGISGSGKTSLLDAVHDTVGARLARVEDQPDAAAEDGDGAAPPGPAETSVPRPGEASATGEVVPTRLVRITQQPIGRTPRSNLATYTGLFDHVRTLYARTDLARERHYKAGRFSFNVAAGRCETCQGEGQVSVELLFLPGTWSTCPTCHGARYNPETLEVTWQGLSIADVLALTVAQALDVFAGQPAVHRALDALAALGLGYLTLGQPATELSGGEAQRIKLASELQTERRSPTLYLLDEPTSGLHPADVHRLLRQLHALVDAGHTVVLAEHDAAALATADWVVELGPGAGDAGGRVVATGPPSGPGTS
ncbi:excinuclease ABC subunit UvrA [Ornithinimicrobium sediminis]|uniref:excinuclease ABC subunit UvrA n=1 Tax=Ornithinimicrobium sediminis TaxID=2904603 RepID=UPI001E504E3F|nr:excinuclease ABC subunit UvrA [Ornithinimicrobium sediminis]MCE0485940.1 excinuclease ABC subunit UvrA [Ornithinimicrobium sediminis]